MLSLGMDVATRLGNPSKAQECIASTVTLLYRARWVIATCGHTSPPSQTLCICPSRPTTSSLLVCICAGSDGELIDDIYMARCVLILPPPFFFCFFLTNDMITSWLCVLCLVVFLCVSALLWRVKWPRMGSGT